MTTNLVNDNDSNNHCGKVTPPYFVFKMNFFRQSKSNASLAQSSHHKQEEVYRAKNLLGTRTTNAYGSTVIGQRQRGQTCVMYAIHDNLFSRGGC